MDRFILDDFLPYQLAVVAQIISRDFSHLYRDRFGISIPEWRVLAHLSQEGMVSVREIHDRVAMDKSKVSRAASRLEAAGYITKAENAQDRRLVCLTLTDKGHDLVHEIAPLALRYEQDVMAQLGEFGPAFREAVTHLIAKG